MLEPLKHMKIVAEMLHYEIHTFPDLRFKSGRRGVDFEDCHSYVCRKARESLEELITK